MAKQRRGGLDDGSAAAHGLSHEVTVWEGVPEPGAVAVAGREEGEEAGQLEEGVALAARAGTELQGEAVVEEQDDGELSLFDVLLAIGLAAARGDVPVDVAYVVAELVLDHLIELAAAAAKHRAVFSAEQRVRRV